MNPWKNLFSSAKNYLSNKFNPQPNQPAAQQGIPAPVPMSYGLPTKPTSQPASAPTIVNSVPYTPPSTGGSIRGLSAGPAPAPKPAFSFEDEIANQQAKERAEMERMKLSRQEGISKSFDPIFSELDRQLGALPGQHQSYEQQLGSLAESQLAGIRDSQSAGEANLARAQEATRDQAQSSLRDLESDIRNHLQAGSRYLGVRGAGDSSAAGEVSEAITREGLKARSNVLGVQDKALGEIQTKLADVKTLASQETRKVDEWKSTKLFELGQFFSEKVNELNMQKANASAEKQRAITEMIGGLEQDFLGRLRQLDDSVINYKSSIATWEMQRAAEMEDYARKLSMSSSYGGGSDNSAAMKASLDTYNKLIGQGMSQASARQIAQSNTGFDPLGGYELTPEDIERHNQKTGYVPGLLNPKPGLIDRIGNLFN